MKLRKLFLGAAVASLALGLGTAGLQAAETGLTQNFDYSADGIGAVGGSNAYDIYAKSNVTNEVLELVQVDGRDALHFGVTGNGDSTESTVPKLQIRDSGVANSVFNKEGASVVIKTSYKTVRTYTKCFYIHQADLGTIQISQIKGLAANTWHDLTIVLKPNAGANGTGAVYAYANGALLPVDDKTDYISVAADKVFNGKINEIGFQAGKSDFTYEEGYFIDYVSVAEYTPVTATVDATKTVSVGDSVEIAPVLSGEAAISAYNVEISDTSKLTYENGKFWGQAEGQVEVKFNFVDELIQDVTTTVTVEAATSDILVSDVTLNELFANGLALTVGQSFKTAQLFTALPATATNKTLNYAVQGDALSYADGVITAVKGGSAKLVITSADGNLTKEFDVTVKAGNFASLNDYALTDKWLAPTAELTYTGWEALEYTGTYARVFTETEVVEDELFGKAIKYNGTGSNPSSNEGTMTGGAAIIKHIPMSELQANKDYKISGWAKVDTVEGQVAPKTRVDVKVYAYKLVNGAPSYLSGAPYSMQMTSLSNFANTGWRYFELPSVVNADAANVDGFKIEVITWNCQQNTFAYASNIAFEEQDTVVNVGWKATVNGQEIKKADNKWPTFEAKLGDTLSLVTAAVPSTSVASELTIVSSNPELVKVENGVITTLATGEATITITDADGKSVEFTVVVKNDATSVTLGSTNIELTEEDGYYGEFALVIEPAGATSTFTATVNAEGLTAQIANNTLALLGEVAGTYTVTITCVENPEVSVVVTVVVKEAVVEPEPSTPSTDVPTTEAPTTEAPTTQEPTTEAPTTQAPTTPEAPKTEKGCKGSVVSSVMAMVTLAGAVVLAKKRRK